MQNKDWLEQKPEWSYRLGLTGQRSGKPRLQNFSLVSKYMPSDCRVLEIGVCEGWSADYWLCNLVGPGGAFVGIDPFTDWPKRRVKGSFVREAAHKVIGWHKENAPFEREVTLIEDVSSSALSELSRQSQKFDLIYVDGRHDGYGVMQDMINSWELLKVGGIWLFDDYGARRGGVKPAYENVMPLFGSSAKELFRNWQVAVQKTDLAWGV